MLVVNRFRIAPDDAAAFRVELEAALAVLAVQQGYVDGHIGRNVDDPQLWLLQTTWSGPGAYRRALSAYEVKLTAWPVLGRAIEESSAYELVLPGEALNDVRPRGVE